jgi:hypothetical protein
MGHHSEDSNTTFKAKDQAVINASPSSRRAASNLSRKKALAKKMASKASSTSSYGFNKSKGSVRAQQRKAELVRQGRIKPAPVVAPAPSVPKAPSVTVKPKTPVAVPKKPTKTVKPAAKSIAVPKSKPVSISTPKPTAVAAPAKTTTAKQSKPNVKKADKSFSKMVKLRTKANIIAGDDSMSDKRKQRKLGRLRKRYDRQATKQKKSRPSIGDAYKVNL